MTISTGDRLPEATLRTITAEGPQPVTTSQLFSGKKAVLFAVPGAFTPTCHRSHMPGFVEMADAIKAKGVDMIACVSTNDVFVLDAWAEQTGAKGKIQLLSDGNADFTRALGLELDGTGMGLGIRSKRYAMIVEDGVVKELLVEPQPGQAEVSSAQAVLERL